MREGRPLDEAAPAAADLRTGLVVADRTVGRIAVVGRTDVVGVLDFADVVDAAGIV